MREKKTVSPDFEIRKVGDDLRCSVFLDYAECGSLPLGHIKAQLDSAWKNLRMAVLEKVNRGMRGNV